MSKRIQGIELAVIPGRRGYAPDIIVNTETDEQVAACANPDLTALFVAAPEMVELIQALVRTWEYDCQYIPCDTEAASALSNKLARLAAQAAPILTKIEGGGE